MTEGREEQPNRKRLETTKVSKDIQNKKSRGQEEGTSKQNTVRNQKD